MPNTFIAPKQFIDYVVTLAHKNGLYGCIILVAGMRIRIPKERRKHDSNTKGNRTD